MKKQKPIEQLRNEVDAQIEHIKHELDVCEAYPDVVDSIHDALGCITQYFEDAETIADKLESDLEDAQDEVKSLENEHNGKSFTEIRSLGPIVFYAEASKDKEIMQAFELCLKADQHNALLEHLGQFCKQHNTHQLIPTPC